MIDKSAKQPARVERFMNGEQFLRREVRYREGSLVHRDFLRSLVGESMCG
jgi:hypothetical protein